METVKPEPITITLTLLPSGLVEARHGSAIGTACTIEEAVAVLWRSVRGAGQDRPAGPVLRRGTDTVLDGYRGTDD